MKGFVENLRIDFKKFSLTEDDFIIKSNIHGIDHVYRVMFNVLLLGSKLNDILNTKISFCAAFMHDLSRSHDGHCERHGYDTVQDNLVKFSDLFLSIGLDYTDLLGVSTSSIYHSMSKEIDKEHKFYKPVSMLKDADALDRIRLGELDPSFLRFSESHKLIKRSERLFFEYKDYGSFKDFLYNNLD